MAAGVWGEGSGLARRVPGPMTTAPRAARRARREGHSRAFGRLRVLARASARNHGARAAHLVDIARAAWNRDGIDGMSADCDGGIVIPSRRPCSQFRCSDPAARRHACFAAQRWRSNGLVSAGQPVGRPRRDRRQFSA